jgi:hypothetical protein
MAFDVVIAVLILYRQSRIRPVPRFLRLRMPIFLGAIGIVEILDYTHDHHISTGGFWLVMGVTVVGAGVLGVIRALTVKLWTANHWVVRQGTALTMFLWVVSMALHLATGLGASAGTTAHLEASSFLLYLALTLGIQAYIVHVRAAPLWNALGPEAGQRFTVNFGSGLGGADGFFANFGNLGAFGNFDGTGQPFQDPHRNDPTIIDVEVVDEDPPELR